MRRYSTESDRFAVQRAQRAVRELRGETVSFTTKFWATVAVIGCMAVLIMLL